MAASDEAGEDGQMDLFVAGNVSTKYLQVIYRSASESSLYLGFVVRVLEIVRL